MLARLEESVRDIPNSSIHINLCPQPPPPLLSTTTEHSKCQNPLNKFSYQWMIQRPPQYCVPIANRRSGIESGSFRERNSCTRNATQERERKREREIRNIIYIYIYIFCNYFCLVTEKNWGKVFRRVRVRGWMFWLWKSKGKGKCLTLYCLVGNMWVYLILKFKWVLWV